MSKVPALPAGYDQVCEGIVQLLHAARVVAARNVNALMTASYWEIGRRIVEAEQSGKRRAGYGEQLIERLSLDLTQRFGRGFGSRNLEQMRLFFLTWPIAQTVSAQLTGQISSPLKKPQTVSAQLKAQADGAHTRPVVNLSHLAQAFTLPWSAYVRLLSVQDDRAREFYETEAFSGGWSVRQLDRQISSQFYERTALSRNKAAMLRKGALAKPQDLITPEESIKDPFVLEFLALKDEYSESQLEDALIHRLEDLLLELGDDFAFVGRQKRLRLDDTWFRVDLVFFHRRLRCLVIVDLKVGKFSYADAGQMHMYLNYAKAHWMREGENPPVGLILCSQRGTAEAHYALEGLPNKVLAAQYQTVLPNAEMLQQELARTRLMLETIKSTRDPKTKGAAK